MAQRALANTKQQRPTWRPCQLIDLPGDLIVITKPWLVRVYTFMMLMTLPSERSFAVWICSLGGPALSTRGWGWHRRLDCVQFQRDGQSSTYIIFPPANSDQDLTSGGMPSFRGSFAFMHCAKRSAVCASTLAKSILHEDSSSIPSVP